MLFVTCIRLVHAHCQFALMTEIPYPAALWLPFHQGAIGVLTHLNAASNNRTLRLAAGQAVASLVPLDAEGIDMIRSLRLG